MFVLLWDCAVCFFRGRRLDVSGSAETGRGAAGKEWVVLRFRADGLRRGGGGVVSGRLQARILASFFGVSSISAATGGGGAICGLRRGAVKWRVYVA